VYTNYILDPNDRVCPKLAELEKLLEECRQNSDVKVIVFSEWERMLELVRELCDRMQLGYAWHTGSVPQRRRRAEINLFKNDPNCRVFLSTDSGSTGLNLQTASVVINCDLPWNPARLEQRIARAWRKHQTRAVTVIHLVSENTIEQKMLGTLAHKQALADGVLDLRGDLKQIKLTSGRQSFLAKIQQLVAPAGPQRTEAAAGPKPLPVDRAQAFSERAFAGLNGALVRCEERYPMEGAHSVLVAVVERDAPVIAERLRPMFDELFGKGQSDPLAPTRLEVIDRATDEALNRLAEAGLITRTTRATRRLEPGGEKSTAGFALSDGERQALQAHREQATRKLRAARLLAKESLDDDARRALAEAGVWIGKALAVKHRFPEPAELDAALAPPLSLAWAESLPQMREFVANPGTAVTPLTDTLDQLLQSLG
jgi:hypothetical protein